MLNKLLKPGYQKINMYKENLTWHLLMNSTWILKDRLNRIEGHVMRPGVHSKDWIAMIQGKSLGRFINPDDGKLLVEQSLGIRT